MSQSLCVCVLMGSADVIMDKRHDEKMPSIGAQLIFGAVSRR